MNGIFFIVFLLCAGYFLIFAPEAFLPALLDGASKAAALCVALLTVYSVWLGLLQVMENSGISEKISRILRPAVKKLFRTDDEEALKLISLNLSANMLGVSGAATPFGIRATERLASLPHARYNHDMLFVLNATGVQLLPTTVLALFLSYGAANPYSLILPSFLCTAISTSLGATGIKLFLRRNVTKEKKLAITGKNKSKIKPRADATNFSEKRIFLKRNGKAK